VKAGREISIQPRIIAEVAKSQMGQMHVDSMACPPRVGEFFAPSRMVASQRTAGLRPAARYIRSSRSRISLERQSHSFIAAGHRPAVRRKFGAHHRCPFHFLSIRVSSVFNQWLKTPRKLSSILGA
jgi:hypothetical protein